MRLTNGVYGLIYSDHSGGCCGIIHLHTFPIVQATHSQRVSWIREAIKDSVLSEFEDADDDNVNDWRCAVEVVLNEHQTSEWRESVEAVGFNEVFGFLNQNSGNVCHVFYLEHGVSS